MQIFFLHDLVILKVMLLKIGKNIVTYQTKEDKNQEFMLP